MKTKIGLILVVLGMLFQSLNADITTGLVAYYPFNGNANDESGNGNNGTVNGATLTTDRFGNANSAYSFGINNANIQIPNSVLNSLAQSTISAWVYWDGNTPSIIMAKQHNGYDSYCIFGIGMYSSADGQPTIGEAGRIYFRAKNYSELLTSSALLEKGKWTHLLVTLGQDAKLFMNGSFDKLATGSNFSIPTDLSSTSSNLGAWFWEGKYKGAMNGKLDEVRIYNRALSGEEIAGLYGNDMVNLTMAISPAGTGMTSPSVGTTAVEKSKTIMVTATPGQGYTFVNWTAYPQGHVTFEDPKSACTGVKLCAAATITANFAINTYTVNFTASAGGSLSGNTTQTVTYGASSTPVTAIPDANYRFTGWTMVESRTGTKYATFAESGTGEEALSAKTPYYTDNPLTIRNVTSNMTITANFKFILKVDSFKEIMSNENGQLIYKADKKLYTFKPDKSTGGKSAFSISLASGKRYWNFRESGLELSGKIDNFDGLDISLTVNDKTFGSILDADETSLHKFTKNKDNYKELSAAGQEFDAFSVDKAEGKVFNYRLTADSFKINSGTMALPAGYEFSANDAVSLIIDDAEFIADNPSAWKISNATAVYKDTSKKGVITMLFNLANNTWRAKVEKADLSSYISAKDGIEIHLIVGDCEGAAIINADTSTFLKYDNGAGR